TRIEFERVKSPPPDGSPPWPPDGLDGRSVESTFAERVQLEAVIRAFDRKIEDAHAQWGVSAHWGREADLDEARRERSRLLNERLRLVRLLLDPDATREQLRAPPDGRNGPGGGPPPVPAHPPRTDP